MLVAVACAPTDDSYRFVKSSDGTAFFKVPATWHMFNKDELLQASNLAKSEELSGRFEWLVGFDASPTPSIDHVVSFLDGPSDPAIQAYVREMSAQAQTTMSLQVMTNSVINLDELVAEDVATMIGNPTLVVMEDGAHGVRLTYDIARAGGRVNVANKAIRVTQISVVDLHLEHFYEFFVTCEVTCYEANQKAIDQVVDSWTVREQ